MDELDEFFNEDIIIQNFAKDQANLNKLRKEWQAVADKFVTGVWIKRYINDQQKQTLAKHYAVIIDSEASYSEYKKSFNYICKFMGLNPKIVIIEDLKFVKDNKDKKQDICRVRYSKGLAKIKIPDGVSLIHVSPVDNITALEPSFRSKKSGRWLYPTKRCYFTIMKDIKSNQAGLSNQKTYRYRTKENIKYAYIDPSYNKFADRAVYIETDSPIPVEKYDHYLDKVMKSITNMVHVNKPEVEQEQDVLDENVIDSFTNFMNRIKSWKTSNEAHAKQVYKSSSVSDDDYVLLDNCIKTMKTSQEYPEYKKAFDTFCKYCHIVPRGTILCTYNLKKGAKNQNNIYVEYSYNTKKMDIPDDLDLYHLSKVGGITELKPFFRGKEFKKGGVTKGYLYDKPRVYLTVHKNLPKFLADYKTTDSVHKYKTKTKIKSAYVDPLVWTGMQGAMYVETNSPIPVEELKPGMVQGAINKANDIVSNITKPAEQNSNTAKNESTICLDVFSEDFLKEIEPKEDPLIEFAYEYNLHVVESYDDSNDIIPKEDNKMIRRNYIVEEDMGLTAEAPTPTSDDANALDYDKTNCYSQDVKPEDDPIEGIKDLNLGDSSELAPADTTSTVAEASEYADMNDDFAKAFSEAKTSFDYLEYCFNEASLYSATAEVSINEGAGETIVNAIKTIIKKLRDAFMAVINKIRSIFGKEPIKRATKNVKDNSSKIKDKLNGEDAPAVSSKTFSYYKVAPADRAKALDCINKALEMRNFRMVYKEAHKNKDFNVDEAVAKQLLPSGENRYSIYVENTYFAPNAYVKDVALKDINPAEIAAQNEALTAFSEKDLPAMAKRIDYFEGQATKGEIANSESGPKIITSICNAAREMLRGINDSVAQESKALLPILGALDKVGSSQSEAKQESTTLTDADFAAFSEESCSDVGESGSCEGCDKTVDLSGSEDIDVTDTLGGGIVDEVPKNYDSIFNEKPSADFAGVANEAGYFTDLFSDMN